MVYSTYLSLCGGKSIIQGNKMKSVFNLRCPLKNRWRNQANWRSARINMANRPELPSWDDAFALKQCRWSDRGGQHRPPIRSHHTTSVSGALGRHECGVVSGATHGMKSADGAGGGLDGQERSEADVAVVRTPAKSFMFVH